MKEFECNGCHWCPDTFLCKLYEKYRKNGKVKTSTENNTGKIRKTKVRGQKKNNKIITLEQNQ